MKHLFAPYNLSLLAKEKWFNEPCLRYYNVGHNKDAPIRLSMFKNEQMGSVSAPLYQQLVDWFREKHQYNIVVIGCEMIAEEEGTRGGFTWCINKRSKVASALWEPKIEDYYDCLNKALEEAFKLI